MPTYQVTDPQTGQSLRLTGDSPPTEQELEQIFAQQTAQQAIQPQAPEQIAQQQVIQQKPVQQAIPQAAVPQEPVQPPAQAPLTIGRPEIQQFVEPALTAVTGAIAEPIAGLAGLATLPFADTEQAEKNIETVREALTFIPRSPEGMKALQKVAEVLEPVAETIEKVEKGIGGAAFEATGSPLAGALAETTPTAAISALGLGPVRRVLGAQKVKEAVKSVITPSAKKLLQEAAPTIEGLKQTARKIYSDIDDFGAFINPSRMDRLSAELRALARNQGFNKRIHPKVSAALDEFETAKRNLTLTDVDTLRKVTKAAAASIEPSEARLGSLLIDKIDDMLDGLKPEDFVGTAPKNIGAKYKDARQLWHKAKKSELLEEAFTKAGLQATGFENGIRVQFRSILNNKKKLRGFTSEEINAMRKVVKGGTAENLAKMIGRFGFSEGQASNMLMGSLGVAGGAAVGGPAGAVAVPLIGQVSRSLAQKLTRNSARGADLIVRAGDKGEDVVKAYFKAVPKKDRNISELTELLKRPNISLASLKKKIPTSGPNKKLVGDAVFFASFIQSQKESE
jgi:hypothetical protein